MGPVEAHDLFELLSRLNLSAGAAIVLVMALRKVVRKRFGARLAYGLWLLPLLAAAAVFVPAPQIVINPAAPVVSVAPATPGFPPVSGPFVEVAGTGAYFNVTAWAVLIWIVGVMAAAGVMTCLQLRSSRAMRQGELGPAVVGVFFPKVVTPKDFGERFTGEEQALVLAHEEAHVARHHSRLNALAAVIQCLCWFNPLVHIAAHLARIDQELACDEAVIMRFPHGRRAYAQALVKAQLAIRPLPLGCYWPSGTEHPLLERIAMLKFKDVSPGRRTAGAAALALLCTAAAATAWAAKPAEIRIGAASAKAPAIIPEMTPTGAMLPAYGSYAAGTPATRIMATTPEMRPTGAMRQVFDERLSLAQVAVSVPTGQPVTPSALAYPIPNPDFNGVTRAEAYGSPATVEGTIKIVRWINPQTIITLLGADGKEFDVASTTPNSLLREGVTRQTLAAGRPLRVEGFKLGDGVVQARLAGMTSNGKPLTPNGPNAQPSQPQWGAVVEQSPLTNSVMRE